MGYWNTDEEGNSFSGNGEMIWGDRPADYILDGWKEAEELLISREKAYEKFLAAIKGEKNEVFSDLYSAKAAFQEDVGRPPSEEELLAGIKFEFHEFKDNPDNSILQERLIELNSAAKGKRKGKGKCKVKKHRSEKARSECPVHGPR